ncbi:ATP-grasp domain-containing protein [Pilibacter termitis]|uniref:ATP-grasp domain-containing protein n=1 Tax=Pilibacter termitis TaxID=263852 RepID=A0A1T4RFH7_9ENTE|nr:ATP-grasp domain-containing protein [Pilibacter termitis]SKA14780.1 ATP-grasp domain-containing protein [Pilibacter termitis]
MKENILVYLCDIPVTDKSGRKWVERLNAYPYKKILISPVEEYSTVIGEYFDDCIKIDNLFDFDKLSQIVRKLCETYKILALYAPKENLIELGGKLRSHFGIQGMQETQTLAVRDKWIMKQLLHQKKLPTSKVAIAFTADDAIEFAEKIGYPIVAKHPNGFATINTKALYSKEEIIRYFENLTVDNALLKPFVDKRILLEEFIKGEEYHCDCIVKNGKVVFSSVSKYLYNCMEIATKNMPPASITFPHSEDEQPIIKKIRELNEQVIATLGINNTITHGEYFVCENQEVYFGEIGARIGGSDVMPPSIENTFGVNLFTAMIDIELGICEISEKKDGKFSGMICLPQKAGEITYLPKKEEFADIEGIIQFEVYYNVGDKVSDVADTMTRSGFAIVESDDFATLKDKLLLIYTRFSENLQVRA